jgi:hypothetical protein
MSQINLQINFNPKVVAAILVAIGMATLLDKIPETKAQASPAITGKFGCILNTNPVPYLTQRTNTYAFINQMSVVDFDARTINGTISNVIGFNTMSAVNQNDEGSATFTISSGPFSGSYIITSVVPGGGIGTYITVPVNSGNTILIKSREEGNALPETGVCQRI